jgi:hypothetical protein
MNATPDPRFDAAVAQLQEWIEAAVALDEGHFPRELLAELQDLLAEMKALVDDGVVSEEQAREAFVSIEMAEIAERFPRVRRLLERAWGPALTEALEEETSGLGPNDEEDF